MSMITQAPFTLREHNPDVLTCIANLSNDEVFTPPEMANAMLDLLASRWAESHDGASIWANPNVTFLDPFTKSGVFLREITRRLVDGLASQLPDLQERVDHILTRQVYGIGITRLTALLARRSVYCSKYANGPHSIAKSFTSEDGNIWFQRTEHTWTGGQREYRIDPLAGGETVVYAHRKCKYCGASEDDYGRGAELETHAYAFIHTDDIKARIGELFGDTMQFDVIIGNPPYQLSDGGGNGSSATPIYQHFVEQAKALDPRFLLMITPSRWFTGGKGLDEFRETMLGDGRIRRIVDWPISAEVFPKNGPKGGVSVFLWDRDSSEDCEVVTHFKGAVSRSIRPLVERGSDVFVRFNQGVGVLKKIAEVEGQSREILGASNTRSFRNIVSVRKPFGFASTFRGRATKREGDVQILQKGGSAYVARNEIRTGRDLIDSWKIFVGFAAPGTGDKDTYPHRVISTPFLGEPGVVSTETYLAIGPFASKLEAENTLSYLRCRFTRFLVLLHKPSQNTTRGVYSFVPTQDWSRPWTDQDLYAKYGLTDDEIHFVESIVRPMEPGE
ncbi:Eco57I restriction-modification methylase domain-containing protein [Bifidobacterium tibiigranuli]|uniref:Eco57I restriction-modification methylase domain-containing protein n=1 Tax=Bifidobacterium tibiigranuli TaxID=2172043 RepID=UPI0023540025|nr:Eco57I restriction-modification methylase domain-containing protein [Bifidobacterium tibiigranuli]MCH3973648.1 Eco57I restriction-modification methylase domain-containing protein [Bifidobacterium tibiigranuli]